jgi:hypothetical protein
MKKNRTLWVILLVVLLALCLCCALTAVIMAASSADFSSSWALGSRLMATEDFTDEVDVQEPVRLRLDVPIGDITVVSSETDKISIDATKFAWAGTQSRAESILSEIDIAISQSDDNVVVVVTGLSSVTSVLRSPKVEMTVVVPVNTQLEVNSKVGQIQVTGLHGDLTLDADVGEVILTDVRPVSRLRVTTRVANVEFAGALVPEADYTLESDVGRVALVLPEDSSFSINARSDVGEVRVDFPLVGRSSREGFVSKEVSGDVGERPTTSLRLRSRVGEISVQPQ